MTFSVVYMNTIECCSELSRRNVFFADCELQLLLLKHAENKQARHNNTKAGITNIPNTIKGVDFL